MATDLFPGTQLQVRRLIGYRHHGIYLGDGQVAQFGGRVADKSHANVEVVSLHVFASGGRVRRVKNQWMAGVSGDPPPTRDESVERAKWLVEHHPPGAYNLFGRNCETIANWCSTGYTYSYQVMNVYIVLVVVTTGVLLPLEYLQGKKWLPRWIPAWVGQSVIPSLVGRLMVAYSREFARFRFESFVENYPVPTRRPVAVDVVAFFDELLEVAEARRIGVRPRSRRERQQARHK